MGGRNESDRGPRSAQHALRRRDQRGRPRSTRVPCQGRPASPSREQTTRALSAAPPRTIVVNTTTEPPKGGGFMTTTTRQATQPPPPPRLPSPQHAHQAVLRGRLFSRYCCLRGWRAGFVPLLTLSDPFPSDESSAPPRSRINPRRCRDVVVGVLHNSPRNRAGAAGRAVRAFPTARGLAASLTALQPLVPSRAVRRTSPAASTPHSVAPFSFITHLGARVEISRSAPVVGKCPRAQ